jgi:hypothetical protein
LQAQHENAVPLENGSGPEVGFWDHFWIVGVMTGDSEAIPIPDTLANRRLIRY